MNNEKYKENLKEIGNATLDELQPVIQNTNSKIFELLKNIVNDFIGDIFNKRRKVEK